MFDNGQLTDMLLHIIHTDVVVHNQSSLNILFPHFLSFVAMKMKLYIMVKSHGWINYDWPASTLVNSIFDVIWMSNI